MSDELTELYASDDSLEPTRRMTAVVGIVARLGWSAKAVPHGPSMCLASAAAMGLAVL
jgi:hypothetical protein